jgi:hypothetical protein
MSWLLDAGWHGGEPSHIGDLGKLAPFLAPTVPAVVAAEQVAVLRPGQQEIRIRRVGPYRPDRRVRLNREGRIDPSRAAIPIVTGEALGISSFAGVGGALAAVALVAPCGRRWPLILSGVISLASFGLLHGHVTATGSARARLVALGQRHPRAEINTRHMLFRIPQLIVDISAGMTLEPGAGFACSLRTSCEATVYGYVLILSALMILTE